MEANAAGDRSIEEIPIRRGKKKKKDRKAMSRFQESLNKTPMG